MGGPVHGDRKRLKFLVMEAMQYGLNWNMMLQKREIFSACFDGFDYDKAVGYGEADIQRIMDTPGMIHSRRKIEAIVRNARPFQYLGSITVYAHLQACGTINDHGEDCPCFARINGAAETAVSGKGRAAFWGQVKRRSRLVCRF